MGYSSLRIDLIEEKLPSSENFSLENFSREKFEQGQTIGCTNTGGKIKLLNVGSQQIVCKERSNGRNKRTFSELVNFEYLSFAGEEGLVSREESEGAHFICDFYGTISDAEHTYIFMEKGEDVYNLITRERGPLVDQWKTFSQSKGPNYSRLHKSPWESQVSIFARQIAMGLRYIHVLGYCHGDLKIENLIHANGVCKIIDFETMRPLRANDRCTAGTRSYASWEFNNCRHNAKACYDSGKNDIWTFGVAIFIMMCEFPPFSECGDDYFTLITQGVFPTRRPGSASFEVLQAQMQQNGLSPDFTGLLSGLNQLVTDEFIEFITMFLKPESTRCTWEQILTHPWLEVPETSLYNTFNLNPSPLDEQTFETVQASFPFLLDEKSCENHNFLGLVWKCIRASKNFQQEEIITLVTKLYPGKAKAYGYQTLMQKYRQILS